MAKIQINMSPIDFPVLLFRYSTDQILDMALEVLENQGAKTSELNASNLGSAIATVESDLGCIFPPK